MVKIADAIYSLVNQNLLYSLLVSSGLVNYTSLAKKIKVQVGAMTGKDVKTNTIVKVLTGMEQSRNDCRVTEILKNSNLVAEYRYTEKYCQNASEIGEDTILAVKEENHFRCIKKSEEKNDLALIRILLPKNSAGEPGITLLIVEYLNLFGLSVKNIYRLDTEIWLTITIGDAGIVLDRLSKFFYKS